MCSLEHDHKHGVKTTCYHHGGCRCAPCTTLHDTRAKARRRGRAYGTYTGMVDSLGTRRRIQALNALGWSDRAIGEHVGMYGQEVYAVKRYKQVTQRMRERIETVYDALSGSVPPVSKSSVQAKAAAKRRGFVPPLAWNDIDTDAAPVGIGREKKRQGTLRGEELFAEIVWLAEDGAPAHQIAASVGKRLDTLEKYVRRHHRDDLLVHLKERKAA